MIQPAKKTVNKPAKRSVTKSATKSRNAPSAHAGLLSVPSAESAASTPSTPAASVAALYEATCTLLRIFTVSEDTFAPAGGAVKYNGADFQAIQFIGRKVGCMAIEVARFLNVSPTTATSTLDRLVRRGLVDRARPDENRRAVSLSLTESGLSLFGLMVDHDMRNMELMLKALEPQEREPFVSAMTKIARRFASLSG